MFEHYHKIMLPWFQYTKSSMMADTQAAKPRNVMRLSNFMGKSDCSCSER